MLKNIIKILLIPAMALAASSCSKKVYIPAESQSENKVYIEREVIRDVIDTVTVYVEIPAQSVSVTVADTVSFIETDYAESYARWNDGMLTHLIKNKVDIIPQQVTVARTETERYKERTDTVTIKIPYQAGEQPGAWAQFKIKAFGWLLSGLLLSLAYIFRKPLLRVIRKFVNRC